MNNIEELYSKVFPNLSQNYTNFRWLCERAILAPQNDMVEIKNNKLLSQLPGREKVYSSIDSVVNPQEAVNYPVEFLNSLQPSGVPPHQLKLRIGCLIMLLRNFDVPTLCNGTQLVVKQMMPRVLEATILKGPGAGNDVFIPRIPLMPSNMPFDYKCLQFPVCISLAMSITKCRAKLWR